jgi:hypothetical protein
LASFQETSTGSTPARRATRATIFAAPRDPVVFTTRRSRDLSGLRWRERVTGALMAYFLYQHLGNLSPPQLAEESLIHELQRDDDGGPRLRERARH